MSRPRPQSPERPLLRLVASQSEAELPPDPRNFDAVFRRYSPYVARVGLRLLGSENELDDLVQEVFIEAHRGLETVREPAAVRGWLARICVRRAVRRLRRHRLRAVLSLDSLPDAVLPAQSGTSPEQAAEVAAVYRILGRMSAMERVIWVLRHVEGESLDDIASICESSKSTVQRRLRTAQARFEQEVSP
ncbi:MAG TPA: sigma-70 family RNA polymerase sigma factor [Polyangiaceae bacterium]|nr:sigma-70 family RNA polymerase sigma factor [Polyangiaceae bacterium]